MTYEEFRLLVKAMRRKQKDYFRSRDRGVLDEARDLERRVDDEIDHEQHELFPQGAD